MSQISARLRSLEDEGIAFWCPGCDSAHHIKVGVGRWKWDNNVDKPTFSPSILVRTGTGTCHSFVTEGQIQFLQDCTHKLAGQTLDLPFWPGVENRKPEPVVVGLNGDGSFEYV